MKQNLLIASLVALSTSFAAAQPHPTPPPLPRPPPHSLPAHTCAKAGGVMFEQKLELEPNPTMNVVNEKTWTITVWGDGTWERHDLDASGRNPGHSGGCLAPDLLTTIKRELAASTWTVKQHDIACAAVNTVFTSYAAMGKPVYAEHTCQTAYLDEKSAHAIATIGPLLVKLTTPVSPPCCKP